MSIDGRMDDLIEAGWGVLDSDFDPIAFHHWRRRAFDCLSKMVGPNHPYTRHFGNLVQKGARTELLAAAGILSAARQGIAGTGLEASGAHGCVMSLPDRRDLGSINRKDM
jgi:hypothetical protein